MTVAEYVTEWEKKLEIGAEREYPLSDLYAHFKKGTFTPEQVLEFYRQRDSPKWIEKVKIFEQGKLFSAQTQSFESWSHCDYAKEDKAIAENYLCLEDAAQMRKAKGAPEQIRAFIFTRVYGKRPSSDQQDQKAVAAWGFENKRNGWTWMPSQSW